MAKFTCPFCIREYDLKDVLYVCPNCGKRTERRFWEKEPIKCKNQIEDSDGNKGPCGGVVTRRVCPLCLSELPKTILATPYCAVSIVGGSAAGKTSYITVMLDELSHFRRIALGAQTTETKHHQMYNHKLIYNERSEVQATLCSEVFPQIWFLRNLSQKRGNVVPTYSFSIYDPAGEVCENSLSDCAFITASNAIIAAIDPLSFSFSKGSISTDAIYPPPSDYDSGQLVNEVAQYIRDTKGIKAQKKIDVPIAIVLMKMDVIFSSSEIGDTLGITREESRVLDDRKVNTIEVEKMSNEIQDWLQSIGENGLVTAVENNFSNYHFFGVSSFGASPKDGHTLPDEIKPHRVLDPILWLFNQFGYID